MFESCLIIRQILIRHFGTNNKNHKTIKSKIFLKFNLEKTYIDKHKLKLKQII